MDVVLTLSLDDEAESEQKQTLFRFLSDAGWVRSRLTARWYKPFRGKTQALVANISARTEVCMLATAAGVNSYEAVVHSGEGVPMTWKDGS